MDELDKGIEISIGGPARERALERFLLQVRGWGVALPPVEPLVLDFGLGRFDQVGLIEYWIANETAGGYCGKYLFLFDGQSCPAHSHGRKTETFFVMKGAMRVSLDGGSRVLREGEVLLLEPGHEHAMTGLGPCLFLELSSPCAVADNRFRDPRIPIGTNAGGS